MGVWIALLVWITLANFFTVKGPKEKQKKRFLLYSGIAIVFVMGARFADPKLDGDLNNYARIYQIIRTTPWDVVVSSYDLEPGYLLMNKLLSSVFPWMQTILFAEAIICVYFTFRFLYYYCDELYLAVLMYLAQGPFIFELTGFRQAIAISLCLFAVEFVRKRKFLIFGLIIALAYTFHSTAIVFAVIYFIAYLKPSFKNVILYAIGLYFLVEWTPELLLWGSELTGSDYTETVIRGNLTGPLISITLYAISGWLFLRENKRGHDNSVWKWNMMICGVVTYLLRFVSLPFERISFYFSSSTMVMLPDGILTVFTKDSRKAAYVFTAVVLAALFLVRISTTAGMDYRFFWMA